jgi:hypothetical protein
VRLRKTAIFWLLLVGAPCSLRGQAKGDQQSSQSLRRFVQSFYDWYVPIALRDDRNPASYVVLTDRATSLNSELLRALETDFAAQANATEGIVGLDWDPFLGTQDPDDHYVVGKTTRQGKRYFVDVYSVRSGKRGDKPDVIPELTWQNGSWVFVNFHYPHVRSDLLRALTALRESRK